MEQRSHTWRAVSCTVPESGAKTEEGIEKYLGSGMIRGVGPVYARKLVRAFGNQVFDVIEAEPHRLREAARHWI
jgi:exodeoxyribonuclease V alpha subunit